MVRLTTLSGFLAHGTLALSSALPPVAGNSELQNRATTPNRWENLGGTFASAPSLISGAPNGLDAFAVGTDGVCWCVPSYSPPFSNPLVAYPASLTFPTIPPARHRGYNGKQWGTWEALRGTYLSRNAPVPVSWGPDRLDIIAQGQDAAVWYVSPRPRWATLTPNI